jgi:hypothetical protein
MSIVLSEKEEIKICHEIEGLAISQMTDVEIAHELNYTLEEFKEILAAYPEWQRKIEFGRTKGIARLKDRLWEKALHHRSMDALKYLAYEYLGMGEAVTPLKNKGVSMNIPIDQMSTKQLISLLEEEKQKERDG